MICALYIEDNLLGSARLGKVRVPRDGLDHEKHVI
jgi:hypothetical protein